MLEKARKPRKVGRPRSQRSGFQAVRVSNEMRKALRMVCAEFELDSIDQAVEVVVRLWDTMPMTRQQSIVNQVVVRKPAPGTTGEIGGGG